MFFSQKKNLKEEDIRPYFREAYEFKLKMHHNFFAQKIFQVRYPHYVPEYCDNRKDTNMSNMNKTYLLSQLDEKNRYLMRAQLEYDHRVLDSSWKDSRAVC